MKFLCLAGVAILLSCKGPAALSTNDDANGPVECLEPISSNAMDDHLEHTQGMVAEYEVIENMLFVSYSFSGCVKGVPVLYYSVSGEDRPLPTINLELKVRNAGMCDQLLDENSCFLLDEFKNYGRELKIILNEEEMPEHLLF